MNKLFVLMIACLPVATFAQNNQYIVEGSLSNYNAPAKMYFQHPGNGSIVTDSVTLINGKFKFIGEADSEPVSGLLIFNAKGTGLNNNDLKGIMLEQGVITVSGIGMLKHAIIGGTSNNVANQKLDDAMAGVNEEQEKFLATMDKYTDKQKHSVEYEDKLFKGLEDIQTRKNAIVKKFISDNPDLYVSLYVLNDYSYSINYKDAERLYNILSPQLKQTPLGRQVADRLPHLKAIAIGSIAPDFTEMDTSGKMISLTSYRGKYVLVDFWASWCHPCRAENINILKAYNRYKNKNFTVVAISLDGPGERNNWMSAIHQDGMPWTQVSNLKAWDDEVAKLYVINGLPQNFLIDPEGKIIAKLLRGSQLEAKLEQLLGK